MTDNSLSQNDRLKDEAQKSHDRLWAWAQNEKVFGSIELRIPFENGVPQRIYITPTEVKT